MIAPEPLDQLKFAADYEASSYSFQYEQSGFVPRKILEFATGETVLDFGCGPVLNVLGLFFKNAKTIVGFDKLQTNLDFLQHLIDNKTITENQRKAFSYLKNDIQAHAIVEKSDIAKYSADDIERHVHELYGKIILRQGDVLVRDSTLINRFDSIVQSGCFGCLTDEEEFDVATENACIYLKPGGKILMINWLQNEHHVKPFNFNGPFSCRLNESTYEQALAKAGLKIEILERSDELTTRSRSQGNVAILWAVAVKQ